jgi:hypothetical protein
MPSGFSAGALLESWGGELKNCLSWKPSITSLQQVEHLIAANRSPTNNAATHECQLTMVIPGGAPTRFN